MADNKTPKETKDSNVDEPLNDDVNDDQTDAVEQLDEQQFDNDESDDATQAELIESLEMKVQQGREELLRTQAEMLNVRKRSARDVESARKYALDRVVPELLEVFDSLEKGAQVASTDEISVEQLREGTELTLKLMANALKNNGIETIDPMGEAFNPEFHQAMSMVPSTESEPNTVIEVFQKGYSLNGRLIRPALVVVTSKP